MPDPGIVSPRRSAPGVVGATTIVTPSNAIRSATISKIVALSQAEYDALGVWPTSTMYLIVA